MTLAPEFTYPLIRSARRRSIGIIVRRGEVSVRAPVQADIELINEFVKEREPWIQKQLAEHQAQLREQLTVEPGVKLPVMGVEKTMQARRSDRYFIKETDHDLIVEIPEHEQDVNVACYAAYTFYLQRKAKKLLAHKSEQKAAQLSVSKKFSGIRLKKTLSQWGHCKPNGIIQYNWLIMMAPEPVIDYLVAHEVSHLVYADHSERFWNTVAQIHPGYEADRLWLRNNEHRLWI